MFWLIVIAAIGGLAYYMHSQNKRDAFDEMEELSEASPDGKNKELRRMRLDSKWHTINSSGTLISGAHGKREAVVEMIKHNLKEDAAPNIRVEEKLVTTGFTAASGRKVLVIRNRNIQGYNLFVNIEDYGKQLSVSWYLMSRENWLGRLLAKTETNPAVWFILLPMVLMAKVFYTKSRTRLPELMNMFDMEELASYCTTVNSAVKAAVHVVSHDLNLNSAVESWQTRGFLQIT